MNPVSKIFAIVLFVFPAIGFGQEDNEETIEVMDSLYREDQFYLGFSYNLLTDLPEGVIAEGFSGGLELGFIRDFPINERRNVALGVGLGWSFNNYGHSLFIGEEAGSGATVFEALEDDAYKYDTNRFSMHSIDVPIQFRWRTSTPQTYNFWRIYTGLKLGYVFHYRSNFVQVNNTVRQTNIPEFNRFRLGATFSFGYSTFNFNFYYGLNPFFNENARLQQERIEIGTIKIGLMFYLL